MMVSQHVFCWILEKWIPVEIVVSALNDNVLSNFARKILACSATGTSTLAIREHAWGNPVTFVRFRHALPTKSRGAQKAFCHEHVPFWDHLKKTRKIGVFPRKNLILAMVKLASPSFMKPP